MMSRHESVLSELAQMMLPIKKKVPRSLKYHQFCTPFLKNSVIKCVPSPARWSRRAEGGAGAAWGVARECGFLGCGGGGRKMAKT